MKVSWEKSGLPNSAAMSGVKMSATNEFTTCGERGADDDGDRQIDDVAPEDELLELGDDALLALGHGCTPVVDEPHRECVRTEPLRAADQRMRAWASVTGTPVVVDRERVPSPPPAPVDAVHDTS